MSTTTSRPSCAQTHLHDPSGSSAEAKPEWARLLSDAITQPGVISRAYTTFWNYSFLNGLLALFACHARGIEPGPIHTFRGWQKLGRSVRKGERGITLCMPRAIKCKPRDTKPIDPAKPADHPSIGDGAERSNGERTFTRFFFKPWWFVLAQTEGNPYVPLALPQWDEALALYTLGIDRVPFQQLNGNIQGYAQQRQFAVSPVAHLPHRTCLHEIAHIVLGHTEELQGFSDGEERTPRDLSEVEAEAVALICCQSLGLGGEEFSRGYLQHWLGSKPIEDRTAQRIFKAADTILKSGLPKSEVASDSCECDSFDS